MGVDKVESSAPNWEPLWKALLAAFPSRPELERMLSLKLKYNLNNVASDGGLEQDVLAVIDRFDSRNQISDLIRAARLMNPTNIDLRTVAAEILGKEDAERLELESRLPDLLKLLNDLAVTKEQALRYYEQCRPVNWSRPAMSSVPAYVHNLASAAVQSVPGYPLLDFVELLAKEEGERATSLRDWLDHAIKALVPEGDRVAFRERLLRLYPPQQDVSVRKDIAYSAHEKYWLLRYLVLPVYPPRRLVYLLLSLCLLLSVADLFLMTRSVGPVSDSKKLQELYSKARANGRPFVIESLTLAVRVEKEHIGKCKDPEGHKGCEFQRVYYDNLAYVFRALPGGKPGNMLFRENLYSDWALSVESIPGSGEERLVGGSERRKELEVSVDIPLAEPYTVVTRSIWRFPFNKKTRMFYRDMYTGPEEGNAGWTNEIDFIGEMTVLLETDSLRLSPVQAYRIWPTGEIERSDVTVRHGLDGQRERRTLSKRWTYLEPGEMVGIVYSWREKAENE